MLHDLQEIYVLELTNPRGWITVPLGKISKNRAQKLFQKRKEFLSCCTELESVEFNQHSEYLQTFHIRAEILTMHQGGKDTHVRQVNVYGPDIAVKQDTFSFTSPEMLRNCYIR